MKNAFNVALDYQNIKYNPEKISKIKNFINEYNWEKNKFCIT